MNDKPEIRVTIQKKRPKKNAKTYHIETVQDILDAVTSKNIKHFLSDLEMVLQTGLLLKAIHEQAIKEGNGIEGEKVELPYFEWIDD